MRLRKYIAFAGMAVLMLCSCNEIADFGTDCRHCCADESFSGSNGSFYRIGRFVDGLCLV